MTRTIIVRRGYLCLVERDGDIHSVECRNAPTAKRLKATLDALKGEPGSASELMERAQKEVGE